MTGNPFTHEYLSVNLDIHTLAQGGFRRDVADIHRTGAHWVVCHEAMILTNNSVNYGVNRHFIDS